MPGIWIVAGVSGSGRIEKLNELAEYSKLKGKTVKVFDVGEYIRQKAKEYQIPFSLSRILNMDHTALSLLRALAIQSIRQEIEKDKNIDLVFIGMHALFVWKNRLIQGTSYYDLYPVDIRGIITIVDDVISIYKTNQNNPKWKETELPSVVSLQRWMMEEELLSDAFASMKNVQMYVMAKNQPVSNLFAFFFEKKKRIYLSYPITAIRDNPEVLDRIQNEYKPKLEKLFYVFNPLDIKDKTHVSQKNNEIPGFLEKESTDLVDARTIERDFRFISQSDAVVVIYTTDKLSPGVAAEMNYAYSHQIPVYVLFPGEPSPFLTDIASVYRNEADFFSAITTFAGIESNNDIQMIAEKTAEQSNQMVTTFMGNHALIEPGS